MKTLKQLTAWIVMIAMMLSLFQVNIIDAWAADMSLGSFAYGLKLSYENVVEGTNDGLKPGSKIIVDFYWASDDKKAEFEALGIIPSFKWQTRNYSKYTSYAPWTDIEGVNGNTYTVKDSDIGKQFRIVCSVENMTGQLQYDTGGVTNIKSVSFDKSFYYNGNTMSFNVEYYNNDLVNSINTSDKIIWEKSADTTNYNWNRVDNTTTSKTMIGSTDDYDRVVYRVTIQEYVNHSVMVFMYGKRKMLSADLFVLNDDDSINRIISNDGETVYVGEKIKVGNIKLEGAEGEEVLSEGNEDYDKFYYTWAYYNHNNETDVYDQYDKINKYGIYTLTSSDVNYTLYCDGIGACIMPDVMYINSFTSDYFAPSNSYTNCVFTPLIKVVEKKEEVNTKNITSAELSTKENEVVVGETISVESVTVTDSKTGQDTIITEDLENKFDFQWQREDETGTKTNILNETKISYTTTAEDLSSKSILAEVTPKTDEYTGSAQTPEINVITSDPVFTLSITSNTDPTKPGSVLTAKVLRDEEEITSDKGRDWDYIWKNEDGDVLQEGGKTYTAKTEDVGKKVYCEIVELNNLKSNEIPVVDDMPTEDELIVKDNEKPDTPNPSTTKPGNTLVAEFETTEDGINPEEIIYTWYVKGNDGADDEEVGSSKELSVLDELVGKKVYVVLTYPGKDEWMRESKLITVKADTEETSKGECNVIVTQGQSFIVTIPAFVSLNGAKKTDNEANFKTVVTADISGSDSITVEPAVTSFEMTERGGIKKALTATITGNKLGWRYAYDEDDCNETAFESGIERVHKISVAKLSAGKWTGTFNWNITTTGNKIKDSQEYVKYRTYESTDNGLEYIEGSEVKDPSDAEETPWE